jgi:hypothetical protein
MGRKIAFHLLKCSQNGLPIGSYCGIVCRFGLVVRNAPSAAVENRLGNGCAYCPQRARALEKRSDAATLKSA